VSFALRRDYVTFKLSDSGDSLVDRKPEVEESTPTTSRAYRGPDAMSPRTVARLKPSTAVDACR